MAKIPINETIWLLCFVTGVAVHAQPDPDELALIATYRSPFRRLSTIFNGLIALVCVLMALCVIIWLPIRIWKGVSLMAVGLIVGWCVYGVIEFGFKLFRIFKPVAAVFVYGVRPLIFWICVAWALGLCANVYWLFGHPPIR